MHNFAGFVGGSVSLPQGERGRAVVEVGCLGCLGSGCSAVPSDHEVAMRRQTRVGAGTRLLHSVAAEQVFLLL